MADRANISVSYLSLIESGKRQISFSLFIKLCDALEVLPVVVAMMLDFDVREETEAIGIAMERYGVSR